MEFGWNRASKVNEISQKIHLFSAAFFQLSTMLPLCKAQLADFNHTK